MKQKNETNKEFSYRLVDLIEEKTITTDQLAKNISVKPYTVYRYTKGDIPTLEILIKLADYFQCTTDYLLGREEYNSATTFNKCPPFCERLPNLLKELNTNKYKLSRKINLSLTTPYTWQSGAKVPSVETILRIAEKYDRSVDFIIGREK